jgi:hypothetical protein
VTTLPRGLSRPSATTEERGQTIVALIVGNRSIGARTRALVEHMAIDALHRVAVEEFEGLVAAVADPSSVARESRRTSLAHAEDLARAIAAYAGLGLDGRGDRDVIVATVLDAIGRSVGRGYDALCRREEQKR